MLISFYEKNQTQHQINTTNNIVKKFNIIINPTLNKSQNKSNIKQVA